MSVALSAYAPGISSARLARGAAHNLWQFFATRVGIGNGESLNRSLS